MTPLQTEFSRNLTDQTVLSEYPRPTLVRTSYLNLNGRWEYAFTRTPDRPHCFDGTILVPFSPESALSGVQRQLKPDEFLWYRRTISLTRPQPGKRILLHFGAVDQTADVYLNQVQAGSHLGGYLPFTLDITNLVFSGENELLVRVRDVTASSWHARGKQSLKPGGMFYTAQSGIWQTVWAEIVPDNYVEQIFYQPDFDNSRMTLRAVTAADTELICTVAARDTEPVQVLGKTNAELVIPLPDFHPWSPEDPFLYQVSLRTGTDRVSSYFAMRKCDVQTAPDGTRRFFLNNRPYFQAGVLDQGYWPESLCTAPSDEALIADITRMKELGFNMLRKHAKLEPERFYYHCDRLGMLVWQDMVNGGSAYRHWFVTYLATLMNWHHIRFDDGPGHRSLLSRRQTEGQREFELETEATVTFLYNHPSIVVWVPFNEGWGQFDAGRITALIRRLDPSRLIDHASGWFDQGEGDVASLHYYFLSLTFSPEKKRALALTEFGGYSLSVPGHSSCKKVYGYKKFKSSGALTAAYERLMQDTVLPAVQKGIGATVYTQLSDIEEETNGIYTYDRAVCKPDAGAVQRWNRLLRQAGSFAAGTDLDKTENPHG
ncbi:MAG: glycoside hydrolase family 2 TIM barrel-domain containing protein [Eubacteriales bacterium]|nr:glycoside hydrolase family 2 TIM barrel-domain containing protein [Eubacteriales bacterium]